MDTPVENHTTQSISHHQETKFQSKLKSIITDIRSNLNQLYSPSTVLQQGDMALLIEEHQNVINQSIHDTEVDYTRLLLNLQSIKSIKDPSLLYTELDNIKQQISYIQQQAKEATSKMKSFIENQRIKLCDMLKSDIQSIDTFIIKGRSECVKSGESMEATVKAAASSYQLHKTTLYASMEVEMQALVDEFRHLEKCLIEERESVRALNFKAMEDLHAQCHTDTLKMRRDLNQQIIDLTLQLSAEKASYLFEKDTMKYNCAVLVERQKENKLVLLAQQHMLHHTAAELSTLKGRYSKLHTHAISEQESMHVDAQKAITGTEDLHAKAKRLAHIHEIEIEKLKELKHRTFQKLGERLDVAVEKITTLGGGRENIEQILNNTALNPLQCNKADVDKSIGRLKARDDDVDDDTKGSGDNDLIAAYRPGQLTGHPSNCIDAFFPL